MPVRVFVAFVLMLAGGSAYPARAGDLFIHEATLRAGDAVAGSAFGARVAISGDTAIVGAPGGAPFEGQPFVPGAAYVFVRDTAGEWHEVARLTPSDGTATAAFGAGVAISGDTAIVGAAGSGAAYIFERNHGGPNAWGELVKLTASDGTISNLFGLAVSIDGDTAVVGAPLYEGVGKASGAAYVFARNHAGIDAWGEVTTLTASDAAAGALFGVAVSNAGGTILIGAPNHRHSDPDVPVGAAYVFSAGGSTGQAWEEVAELIPNDATRIEAIGVGNAVAVDAGGSTAVIGAALSSGGIGGAFVFARDQAGAWGQAVTLSPSLLGRAGTTFGLSVAISDDVAIVSAGRDKDQQLMTAHVFARNRGGANAWGELMWLRSSDLDYPTSAAISGGTVIVGYPFRDIDPTSFGSARIFDLGSMQSVPVVNDSVSLTVDKASDIKGIGFVVTATLTNTSAAPIRDVVAEVTELSGGNTLRSNLAILPGRRLGGFVGATGVAGGAGAALLVDIGLDDTLDPGESVTIDFAIRLQTRSPFRFSVDVRGQPAAP